jgi:hypothetical protein
MVAQAPQSSEIPELIHAKCLRSFVLSLLPIFFFETIEFLNFKQHFKVFGN